MNILFLTDGIFPFQLGGMQKHSVILARLLARRNHTITIVHCGGLNYSEENFKALFSAEELSNIKELVIPFPKTDPFPGHYIRENKVYSKNMFLELVDEMNAFDIVYSQGFTGWRFVKERNTGTFNAPVLVNFHGFEMFQQAPSIRVATEHTLFRNTVKWNVRNADGVYSFGGKIDIILKDLGVDEKKILQQNNGVEESWLSSGSLQNQKIRTFIFVGRAERRKGIEEINNVLKKLIKDKALRFKFIFVGPLEKTKKIIDNRIVYHGEVRDQKVLQKIIKSADCLVCPNHSGGMPTVILEAMACGLAIIGTDVGAVDKMITNNGVLLESPSAKKLEAAMRSIMLLADDTLVEMKNNSIIAIKDKFLWEKVVEILEIDLQKMISPQLVL